MRLDKTKSSTALGKKVNNRIGGLDSSLLDLLNPLMDANINPNLHSFYDFRELKDSVLDLLRKQENMIFYVLHQNFMCDEDHKGFFKEIVGRYYDVPEKLWGYYKGLKYFSEDNNNVCVGLVLFENYNLYKRAIAGESKICDYQFKVDDDSKSLANLRFNELSFMIDGFSKVYGCDKFSTYYSIYNGHKLIGKYIFDSSCPKTDTLYYYYSNMYNRYSLFECSYYVNNGWYIFSEDDLNNIVEDMFISRYRSYGNKLEFHSYPIHEQYGLYASLGLENADQMISKIIDNAKKNQLSEDIIKKIKMPIFSDTVKKKIKSMSQTTPWSIDYIEQNKEYLDLETLAFNVSIPWNIEFVKFFVNEGLGFHIARNKTVFEKVFAPILTDEIVEKLFRMEYERYTD